MGPSSTGIYFNVMGPRGLLWFANNTFTVTNMWKVELFNKVSPKMGRY